MKKKTINKIIKGKICDWLKTIDDESLKDIILNNIIVTGGCITSMLLNERVNDFDIILKQKIVSKTWLNTMPINLTKIIRVEQIN